MKFFKVNLSLLLVAAAVAIQSEDVPKGFGQYTTGGKGGVEYHVNTLKELKDALQNNGKPEDPKIIYIESPINGYIYDDGSLMTAENLAPGFSFEKYINCFTEDGSAWLGTPECEKIETLRKKGMTPLQKQIKVKVTSNTTIIGNGNDSKIEELVIQISNANNVILKDLSIQAPNDLFPQWTINDGWSCKYDAVVIQGSKNVWIDNCLLDDGEKTVESAPVIFGQNVELHDGLIDIINGSDLITLSNNRFANHRKTILIGNSDSRISDSNLLSVTMYNNVFINCWQRMPRVRFGKVHIFNNLYYIDNYDSYPVRYNGDGSIMLTHINIGIGLESNILSEYNSFNYPRLRSFTNSTAIIVQNIGGHIFKDIGSKFNNKKIDLNALAKKDFELNVEKTKTQNLINGGTNPSWVDETFTTETFNPNEYYTYKIDRNIKNVNKLKNQIPSWMFTSNSDSDSDSGNDL